jgi:hypothetical protein
MPKSSVVVASTLARPAFDRFLGSLLPPCEARGIEVVVARNCSPEEYRALEQRFPSVLFMPAQDNATLSQLRIAGVAAAEGDIVTLIDDHNDVTDAWLADLPPGAKAGAEDA